jgi:hypothetical protein
MSRETFAFLFQLLSAFSVVVSLVYLAFQIRENTRAMRRAATFDIIRDLSEQNRMLITVPDLSELYLKTVEKPQELTAKERLRFSSVVMHSLASFEIALDYHRDGLISDEHIGKYTQVILQLFENPVVMEWWEKEGHLMFSQRLYDLVSERRAA